MNLLDALRVLEADLADRAAREPGLYLRAAQIDPSEDGRLLCWLGELSDESIAACVFDPGSDYTDTIDERKAVTFTIALSALCALGVCGPQLH